MRYWVVGIGYRGLVSIALGGFRDVEWGWHWVA